MKTNALSGLGPGNADSSKTLISNRASAKASTPQHLMLHVQALAEERGLALERYEQKPDAKNFYIERERKLLALLWQVSDYLATLTPELPPAGLVLEDILTGQNVHLEQIVDDFFIQRALKPNLTGVTLKLFITPEMGLFTSGVPLEWLLQLRWQ